MMCLDQQLLSGLPFLKEIYALGIFRNGPVLIGNFNCSKLYLGFIHVAVHVYIAALHCTYSLQEHVASFK